MLDPATKNIMIVIYGLLIIGIITVLVIYMRPSNSNKKKDRKATTFDGHRPVPLGPSVPLEPPPENPTPIPKPDHPHGQPDHGPFPYPSRPGFTPLVGPPDSYFYRDRTFSNQAPQTPCMRALIKEFQRLAHPLNINFTDKGALLPKLVANDKKTIQATWERFCKAINTGIQTCPDMRVRYIVPQGAGEQIEFINDKGTVYIPKNSRFWCIDKSLYPIYFRLNHKGAGITFAINFPDFS